MLYSVTFLSPYNHAIDTVMRKNIVEPDTRQMTIWRINILRLVPKATDTHSEYGILVAFPRATMVTRTFLNVRLYVLCLSCYPGVRLITVARLLYLSQKVCILFFIYIFRPKHFSHSVKYEYVISHAAWSHRSDCRYSWKVSLFLSVLTKFN